MAQRHLILRLCLSPKLSSRRLYATLDFHQKSKLPKTFLHLLWRKPGCPLQASQWQLVCFFFSICSIGPRGEQGACPLAPHFHLQTALPTSSFKTESYIIGLPYSLSFTVVALHWRTAHAHDCIPSPALSIIIPSHPANLLCGTELHTVLLYNQKDPMTLILDWEKILNSGGQGEGWEYIQRKVTVS